MFREQFRTIDGVLYRRHSTPYAYDLRVHQLGKHVEATAMPRHAWEEVGNVSPGALSDAAMCEGNIWVDGCWQTFQPSEQELLDKAAANRERSARRARTAVRRLCKVKSLDTMLTMTYRANVTDREVIRRHLDMAIKRIRRVIPGFQYVAVLERQKRGAWHAHLAVERVQSHYLHQGVLVRSYDLLRAIWRAVVGELGGNIDVARSKVARRSSARVAAYLSKYIGKGLDAVEGGDSYSASGRALPRPVVIRHMGEDYPDACSALVSLLLSFFPPGSVEFHGAHLDGGGYYVALSPL
jgi:hypothetical protein